MRIKGPFCANAMALSMMAALFFSALSFMPERAIALSVEEEKKMGREFLAKVREHFEFVEDDFATQYIDDLGQYLTAPVQTKHFPFNFYIVKDSSLNAFAGPGGHIFIFSGLVEAADRADELASVIAHEIGHVTSRHLAQRIKLGRKIGLATMAGVLAGALIGGEIGAAVMAGTMAAGIQTQLHYSRNDERQADHLSFKYMQPAGFDPAGMIAVLQEMEKGRWLGSDKVPPYLLTHPAGPERMADLDTMLSHGAAPPPKKETARFRDLFPYFKAFLRARCLESREAERLFKLDAKRDPHDPLAHFGLGIVYKRRSDFKPAIHHLKKAWERNPRFIPILTNLADAYQLSGRDREAISVLKEALKVGDEDSSTLFLLGLSYQNLGEHRKAIQLFERLASFEPVKKEVYYHLGISYGRKNILGRAHYNFAIYYRMLGQMDKARFHIKRARDLSGNDHYIRIKIQKEKEKLH
ncbi:MAG: M48 family metalloprotease [Deltaproteobacteria bacterium]|nr:M48 family metalloprotease [Deltaproteobacteria bacterium]